MKSINEAKNKLEEYANTVRLGVEDRRFNQVVYAQHKDGTSFTIFLDIFYRGGRMDTFIYRASWI